MNFNVPESVGPFTGYYIADGMSTTATANHSGGDFDVDCIYVGKSGGTGTLIQSGGLIHGGSETNFGYSDGGTGIFVHSGGDFISDIGGLYVGRFGGTGTLIHSGGLIQVSFLNIGDENGGIGLANISGGSLDCEGIGITGTNGILNHSGGTTTTYTIIAGFADNLKGTVNFTGGNLHIGGGMVDGLGGLLIGVLEGSVGEFNLSNGVVTVDSSEMGTNIGFMGGTGTFHQTGGSFTNSNNHVFIGNGEGSTGTFMHIPAAIS